MPEKKEKVGCVNILPPYSVGPDALKEANEAINAFIERDKLNPIKFKPRYVIATEKLIVINTQHLIN